MLMGNIYIEKYQNTDFRDVIALLVQSFKNKFCQHQKLSNNDIENILYASWHLKADDPAYLHFVAKQNKKGSWCNSNTLQQNRKYK